MLSLIPRYSLWPIERNTGGPPPNNQYVWSQLTFKEGLPLDEGSETLLTLGSGASIDTSDSTLLMTNTTDAALNGMPPPYIKANEDFSIESWVAFTSVSQYGGTILSLDMLGAGGEGNISMYFAVLPAQAINFLLTSTGNRGGAGDATITNIPELLQPKAHIAACRVNGVLTIYVNGQIKYQGPHSTAGFLSTEMMSIRRGAIGKRWNIRMMRGKSAYNGPFTPPTELPALVYETYTEEEQRGIVFQASFRRNEFINEITREPFTLSGTAAMQWNRIITQQPSSSRFEAPLAYFGAGDFTIECKFRITQAMGNGQCGVITQWAYGGQAGNSWCLFFTGALQLQFAYVYSGTSTYSFNANRLLPKYGADVHVVVEKVGNIVSMYFDGDLVGQMNAPLPIINNSTVRGLRDNWDSFPANSDSLHVTNIRIAAKALYNGNIGRPRVALPRVRTPYNGPGPQKPIAGNFNQGYFGEVPMSEVMQGVDLATYLGLTEGTPVNADTTWLKFALDGKILFIPKKPLRTGISWQALYQAGAVYGLETGTGVQPLPSSSPVQQTTRITTAGGHFRVRLPTGSNTNPYTGNGAAGATVSEWTLLMNRVSVSASAATRWAAFTNEELGLDVPGSWCQEYLSTTTTSRVCRGTNNAIAGISSNTGAVASQLWRPVLEFITPDVIPLVTNGKLETFVSAYGSPVYNDGFVRLPAGSYLSIQPSSSMVFGTTDFTVDIEFNCAAAASQAGTSMITLVYWGTWAAPGKLVNWEVQYNTANGYFYLSTDHGGNATFYRLYDFPVQMNKWYKMQITRDNGMMQCWVDGVMIGESAFPIDIQLDTPSVMYFNRRLGGSSGQVVWSSDISLRNFRIAQKGRSKLG